MFLFWFICNLLVSANFQKDPAHTSYIEIKYRVPRQQASRPMNEERRLMASFSLKDMHFLRDNWLSMSYELNNPFSFEADPFQENEERGWKKKGPRILQIKSKSLNPKTAEVEIETDDETKCEIEYGISEDYGMKLEGTWNLKHRFIIPELREGIYHFRVKAKDREGNEVESIEQSLEVEGIVPALLKDLFDEER